MFLKLTQVAPRTTPHHPPCSVKLKNLFEIDKVRHGNPNNNNIYFIRISNDENKILLKILHMWETSKCFPYRVCCSVVFPCS